MNHKITYFFSISIACNPDLMVETSIIFNRAKRVIAKHLHWTWTNK